MLGNSNAKTRVIDYDKLMDHPWMSDQFDFENANKDFVYGWKSCKEWIEQQPVMEVYQEGECQ